MDGRYVDPHEWLITPGGRFYPASLSKRVNDGIIRVMDGKVVIRPSYAEMGYVLLRDHADSPAQLAKLVDYLDASMGKPKVELPPQALIPKICRERRASVKRREPYDFGEFADKPAKGAK